MFNSPILDATIGLVFIFLMYSLLATTIREAIASLISLRARMLKKGIVKGMLSEAPDDTRWESIWKGVKAYFLEIIHMLIYKPPKKEEEKKLGDKFYDHPLIKNYGSNRVYSNPSYIPTNNFSTVLIDVLKDEFSRKINEIAGNKFNQPSNKYSLPDIAQNLQNSSDINKIKELLEYYAASYLPDGKVKISNPIIDKDTVQILQLHLRNSIYNIQAFKKKIEDWFDESMDRVSGWYKRQAQLILFLIGISIAVLFNVDVIEIAKKLAEDKDARDKIVQLAIQTADKYKDDPRVKKAPEKGKLDSIDSIDSAKNDSIFNQYNSNIDSAKNLIKGDISNANDILAIGWHDYGRKRDSSFLFTKYSIEVDTFKTRIRSDKIAPVDSSKNSIAIINSRVLDSLYDKHWIKLKVGYVWSSVWKGRKILGLLIFAFAVSLGSPFWFDLLNKLINLRGTGKKESGTDDDKKSSASAQQQPVTVNVNTQQSGQEAVG